MPESDLALLIDAAKAAGEIARRHWRAAPEAWDKPEGAGPVSEADLAVDRMLHESLLAARPGYGWLSEETEDLPGQRDHARTFIVDPIDGTRAFLAGQETWAHSIAIAEDDRVVAGVVYLPVRDKLYAAARGSGATLNGAAIGISPRETLAGADILANKTTLADANWTGGAPDVTRHHRPSLAYRLCLVAEGRFDAMITLNPAWEWDIAAGAVIVEEAGGTVTDRTGAPHPFNATHPASLGVIAAPRPLAAAILAALA